MRVATEKKAASGSEAGAGFPEAWCKDSLRELIAAIPDFVFVLGRDLRLLIANRGVGGRTPQQLEGLTVTELFPPVLHQQVLAALNRSLQGGQVERHAAQTEGFDGHPRHFEIRVTPIRAGTAIVALTLTATEITGQVRAERALATQAHMIESMLEGVAVVNEQTIIEITNPAFDTLFGYARGELVGRALTTLIGWPFERPERWRAAGRRMASMRVEFEGRRANGSSFAAAGVISRFEVAGLDRSLLVLQDVSERKQLERAVLEAVNREQYRIGNDLHDGLGQELTGIALMLRGVAGRLATEYAAILPEVEGITRLVNNAIESTRSLARGLSPVNLERGGLLDALEGLAMHAAELYGVRVTCTHRVKTIRPWSAELANHLYRIAQEAVSNAVRHGRARSIRLHLHGLRAKVRLIVADDGIGMPIEAADSAGMGLKIMRYRARMLGGEVRFERGEPHGTRIVCECPIEPAARAPAPRRHGAKTQAGDSSERGRSASDEFSVEE